MPSMVGSPAAGAESHVADDAVRGERMQHAELPPPAKTNAVFG
jgi:hypothetical protein